MQRRPILVLGAGPAGLAAAWQLARRGFEVTLVERAAVVGGNAASFELERQRVDYGSHRLHPACSPEILADIRAMLGEELIERPRHGRIHLQGRWLHFPLRPADILLHAPPAFAAGVMRDMVWRTRARGGAPTFATILERGLGRTVSREFYFPYARKIWGREVESLDPEQARRRVSAGSIRKLAAKVLSPARTKMFYYPRGGFGRISEGYETAALRAGVRLLKETTLASLEPGRDRLILSTIPLTQLVRMIRPAAPHEVLEAASALEYRAMLLIYLVLECERFSEYDAHYFPSAGIGITRLSEPKNYGLAGTPGTTVLCAELPCCETDAAWSATDDELGGLVLESLERAGIPYRGVVRRVVTRRLPHAYPIYALGYGRHFAVLDQWLDSLDGIVTLGRQGLFAHDNTHHTLAMAYAAARCVGDDGRLDRNAWAERRREFREFVVED